LVYDPCIGQFNAESDQTAVPFVQANPASFPFDASTLAQYETQHEQCGYKAFTEKYLQFPPPGHQPISPAEDSERCSLWNNIANAIMEINPCFDVYEVNVTCPAPYDILQPSNGSQPYFDRADVKAALHAPSTVTWVECGSNPFNGFGGPEDEGDTSPDPIQGVLPQVIQATNRVLIANGDLDFIIITNGTLLAIQNMTWNGAQGFQTAPSTPINIPSQGVMGVQHFERGLMWGETYASGHMEPEYQNKVSFRHLQWLLGYTDTL
jgi:carboxypeptidase D